MTDCYRLVDQTLDPPAGRLDACVDCTYVLIMEGSTREAQIRTQVEQAGLTSRVVFQYNKGYRACEKNLRVNKTNYDLEHALRHAFNHALHRGYERVLVLEDDCEFDERIRDPEILEDIGTFLVSTNPSIYSLGSFLPLPNPFDVLAGSTHQLLLYNSGTHATIYNKRYMEWVATHACLLGHVDLETNRHWSKYTYRVPLAYQKMGETENAREGWGEMYPTLAYLLFRPTGITHQVQPGYDIIKVWADRVSVVLLVVLLTFFLLKR